MSASRERAPTAAFPLAFHSQSRTSSLLSLLFNSFILSYPILPRFLPQVEARGGSSPLGGTKPPGPCRAPGPGALVAYYTNFLVDLISLRGDKTAPSAPENVEEKDITELANTREQRF